MGLIAHITTDGNVHTLEEHLYGTAELAMQRAGQFGNADWVRTAAMLHDLGKASSEFQAYITSAKDSNAHIEGSRARRVNHSTAGAILAVEKLGYFGRLLAYLVAGHHAGLPDWTHMIDGGGALSDRLEEKHLIERVRHYLRDSTIEQVIVPPRTEPCRRMPQEDAFHLWVRMLFSCLVDADFIDTERFMNPQTSMPRGRYPGIAQLVDSYTQHMAEKQKNVTQSSVNDIRRQILSDCIGNAKLEPGFFSLTVPTGGGKTLASLGFALTHARQYAKRRVIYVIPYTSIIEQTGNVFRQVFERLGTEPIVEHHSTVDPDEETAESRLAAENWDAPIIVTTNVQFFESLYAAGTSRCRKLHSIVNSVIILDEAQMLPVEHLRPALSALKSLVNDYKCSVVFCTATQPALTGLIGSAPSVMDGIDPSCVRELMREKSPAELARAPELRRTEVELPPDLNAAGTWSEVAGRLKTFGQVLCIVNTRKDCRELHALMPEGTIHLSAQMCGAHRSAVIERIKTALRAGSAIRVVSTQLVEAGVDFDFPVVFRALAGLDSIAQAAGRCNREGRLNAEGKLGKVVVFVPPSPSPVGHLRKGEQATRSVLASRLQSEDVLVPSTFDTFFHHYFSQISTFDKAGIKELLWDNVRGNDGSPKFEFQFRTAAHRFQMIDDTAQRGFYVRYCNEEIDGNTLIGQLERNGPESWLLRKMQRLVVNIPEREFNRLGSEGKIMKVHDYWVETRGAGLYDKTVGFNDKGPEFLSV